MTEVTPPPNRECKTALGQDYLIDQPDTGAPGSAILLAHGAGAPASHPFMSAIAQLLADQGLLVARFNFDYMALMQATGKRRPPQRMPELVTQFRNHLIEVRRRYPQHHWLVGGKSMGSRAAALLAGQDNLPGAVAVGYPFHPPKKPANTRLDPLQAKKLNMLIVQGERDALGNREEVGQYQLGAGVEVKWLADGDHDLKPRKRSGFVQSEHLATAAQWVANFSEQVRR